MAPRRAYPSLQDDSAEEIVRDLAEAEAPVHSIGDRAFCVLCWEHYPVTVDQHKPECPWRRAKESRA